MRPWDSVITDEDQRRYDAAGFGRAAGIGCRPALLIIDVQYRTTGSVPMPFWQAVEEYPTSCGDVAWRAVGQIGRMLELFRRKRWPVLFPHVAPKVQQDGGRLAAKVPTIMTIPPVGYRFVREVGPIDGDILIPKKHPSAFFGTTLASHLIDLKVDSLVMTGCTTSGCVRASVVDAFSYNFHVAVPEECVYDRSPVAHSVNLFDMAQKYADVLPTDELLHTLAKLTERDDVQ
ncbi:isochorismatase family protein [Bradyrhizobium barranii subsp. apii]|uniref:isochorismatase family protein n=1 Tax=Bradyrhizobium barranii TaxID=2992140 RepID=UPI001CD71BEA|nr:isochorismatase family protein [Bradyrhizobium barranii]UPT93206.1 isochorismatase family protein [Bradyrhizobium barranii subsp. apii]